MLKKDKCTVDLYQEKYTFRIMKRIVMVLFYSALVTSHFVVFWISHCKMDSDSENGSDNDQGIRYSSV